MLDNFFIGTTGAGHLQTALTVVDSRGSWFGLSSFEMAVFLQPLEEMAH